MGNNTTALTEAQKNQFEELAKPLIKFIAENLHPHTKIIVENYYAEIVEGVSVFSTNEFINN